MVIPKIGTQFQNVYIFETFVKNWTCHLITHQWNGFEDGSTREWKRQAIFLHHVHGCPCLPRHITVHEQSWTGSKMPNNVCLPVPAQTPKTILFACWPQNMSLQVFGRQLPVACRWHTNRWGYWKCIGFAPNPVRSVVDACHYTKSNSVGKSKCNGVQHGKCTIVHTYIQGV